jgi:hypothetical protein
MHGKVRKADHLISYSSKVQMQTVTKTKNLRRKGRNEFMYFLQFIQSSCADVNHNAFPGIH